MSPAYENRIQHLEAIRAAALEAAHPGECVRDHLSVSGRIVRVDDSAIELQPTGRVFVVALGKAAPAMAAATYEMLKPFAPVGIVTAMRGGAAQAARVPAELRTVQTEHPVLGSGSIRAGRAVKQLLAGTSPDDLMMGLISGGGSAMLELPKAGVSLRDLQATNRLLLASGMPITRINLVRKALSQVKAGGLARMAAPAPVLALILSDVVGDPLGSIASGPTVLRTARAQDAQTALREFGLWERVPESVRDALARSEGKPRRARRPLNVLVGSNRQVVAAAARCAARLGFVPQVLSHQMRGEARSVARRFAHRLVRVPKGHCLLMGGETTVTVRGNGRGGRNQEFALAACIELAGERDVALMALDTDGIDGLTDAAGAVVDGSTAALMAELGLSPSRALKRNNAHPVLDTAAALIRTGSTGTNVNDLVVGVKY